MTEVDARQQRISVEAASLTDIKDWSMLKNSVQTLILLLKTPLNLTVSANWKRNEYQKVPDLCGYRHTKEMELRSSSMMIKDSGQD